MYVHYTLNTANCRLHNTTHSRLHTAYCSLLTANFTLHTAHFTLRTPKCTQHTTHFTLHTAHSGCTMLSCGEMLCASLCALSGLLYCLCAVQDHTQLCFVCEEVSNVHCTVYNTVRYMAVLCSAVMCFAVPYRAVKCLAMLCSAL